MPPAFSAGSSKKVPPALRRSRSVQTSRSTRMRPWGDLPSKAALPVPRRVYTFAGFDEYYTRDQMRDIWDARGESDRAAIEALQADARRYRKMRDSAAFQNRDGPGLYWYLPRWDHNLPIGERLDAAIDAARRA